MLTRVPTDRARLAWAWVVAWALTIYAVVPFARQFVNALKSAGLLWMLGPAVYLAIACGVIAAVRAFRRAGPRPGGTSWWGLGVAAAAYAAGTWYLRANQEEALHLVEYGVLCLLAFRALSATHPNRAAVIGAALVATAFGMGDEIIQWIVPSRIFDFRDMLINATGGLFMAFAIGAGLRPTFLEPRVPPNSIRMLCRLALLILAILFCCVSATPARLAAIARVFPPAAYVGEEMIQYGHRIALADGSIFFSRLSRDGLLAIDRERGTNIAAVLRAAGNNPADYEAFLREHSAVTDPVVYEARIHLFRRDRYLDYARRKRRNETEYRGNLWVALREHRFLEACLPITLQATGRPYPADLLHDAERLGPPAEPYVSPVSNQLATGVSERTLQFALLLPMIALLGVLRHHRRRT